jgi:hypothetical protein
VLFQSCNLPVSYASDFVQNRSDIPFSFYNQFCDQEWSLVASSMELAREQRICVKFCFKVGRTVAETHMLCEAYGDDALSQNNDL